MSQEFIGHIKKFVNEKIPMIPFTDMDILEIDGSHCKIKIPLQTKTKNHLNSMYFGALAVGADCAGGLIALYYMMQMKANLAIAFKDFKADFLKRPEHDVYFSCHDGLKIKDEITKAIECKERVSFPVHIEAYTEENGNKTIVANFVLTLSMKLQG